MYKLGTAWVGLFEDKFGFIPVLGSHEYMQTKKKKKGELASSK